MEEVKKEERFHEEVKSEMICLEFCPITPKGLKNKSFTIGMKYPVLEKKEDKNYGSFKSSSYMFKTINDDKKEIWISDLDFIPSEKKLTFENLQDKDKCFYEEKELPDIRKLAEENKIPKLGEYGDELAFEKKLAGLDEEDDLVLFGGCNPSDLKETNEKAKFASKKVYPPNDLWREGKVIDNENAVMNDIAKCMAAVSKVFGGYEVVDPDDVLTDIKKHFPRNNITRDNNVLVIDGAATKICFMKIQDSYNGLCKITSRETARKIVSKIIAKKIKKIF